MGRSRRGFTLIEVLAALLIVGLLAGLGVMSVRGWRQTARVDAVAMEVCDFDRSARLYAERFATDVDLVVDSQKFELRGAKSDADVLRPALGLPTGFSVRNCWIAGGEATDVNLTVSIGTGGRSRSYGFCLAGPDGECRWITVSGLTGQVQVAENDAQSKAIAALLSQKRLNPS